MSRWINFLSFLILISCSQSYAPVQEKQGNPLIESSQSPKPTEAPEIDSLYFMGFWSGDLRFDGYHLPMAMDIRDEVVFFDNPAQGVKAIKADSFFIDDATMSVYLGRQEFKLAKETNSTLSMTFSDKVRSHTLVMHRDEPLHKQDRPQTPLSTDDYKADSITFVNEIDDITLAGTLTTPTRR